MLNFWGKRASGYGGISLTKGMFPVHLNKDALLRHQLVLGTTGSGKTEYLLALAEAQIGQGAGLVFVDGKGEQTLRSRLMGISEHFGRHHDFFVMDFSSGVRTHGFNPLAHADERDISEFLIQLMDSPGQVDVWKGRAMALLRAAVAVSVGLRREDFIPYFAFLRRVLLLPNLVAVANQLPLKEPDHFVETKILPLTIRERVIAYLDALPGFSWNRANNLARLPSETVAQHGYLLGNLYRFMDDLVHNFGHIFVSGNGDIEMSDILDRHRILLILLPSLSQSPEMLRAMGRLVLGSLRAAMRQRLLRQEYTGDLPPNLVIMDEVGSYAMPGLDMMAAQARSLDVAMLFASQTLASLQQAGRSLSENILGNCGTKVFLRCEDPFATAELARKMSPQIPQPTRQRLLRHQGIWRSSWVEGSDALLEYRQMIDYDALAQLPPGRGYVVRGYDARKCRFRRSFIAPSISDLVTHRHHHG